MKLCNSNFLCIFSYLRIMIQYNNIILPQYKGSFSIIHSNCFVLYGVVWWCWIPYFCSNYEKWITTYVINLAVFWIENDYYDTPFWPGDTKRLADFPSKIRRRDDIVLKLFLDKYLVWLNTFNGIIIHTTFQYYTCNVIHTGNLMTATFHSGYHKNRELQTVTLDTGTSFGLVQNNSALVWKKNLWQEGFMEYIIWNIISMSFDFI